MGKRGYAYAQDVTIIVGMDAFESRVLFFEEFQLAGLLGRKGFFDNFKVTFDHSTDPPALEYVRIKRVE